MLRDFSIAILTAFYFANLELAVKISFVHCSVVFSNPFQRLFIVAAAIYVSKYEPIPHPQKNRGADCSHRNSSGRNRHEHRERIGI